MRRLRIGFGSPVAGWLARMKALDFAGGSVVHINAGIAGLVCAYPIGPRREYGEEPFPPFNLGLTMAGAGFGSFFGDSET